MEEKILVWEFTDPTWRTEILGLQESPQSRSRNIYTNTHEGIQNLYKACLERNFVARPLERANLSEDPTVTPDEKHDKTYYWCCPFRSLSSPSLPSFSPSLSFPVLSPPSFLSACSLLLLHSIPILKLMFILISQSSVNSFLLSLSLSFPYLSYHFPFCQFYFIISVNLYSNGCCLFLFLNFPSLLFLLFPFLFLYPSFLTSILFYSSLQLLSLSSCLNQSLNSLSFPSLLIIYPFFPSVNSLPLFQSIPILFILFLLSLLSSSSPLPYSSSLSSFCFPSSLL